MRATVLASLLLLAAPARAQPSPCAGQACSEHGACMVERDEAFCFCDEGYAAEGLECRAAPDTAPDPMARRTSSMGARIVRIATDEGGHRVGAVGRDFAGEPGALHQYVKIGSLWCTDFVSWVYRAAGAPFTGGYHGGWHLTNNHAVRRWFSRHRRWVDNGTPEWERFDPRPGDYVRFDTNRYGHSAIVRYVAGGTLYTVEGNSRGEVRLRRYHDYRRNRRIDGIGLATQGDARMALLMGLSDPRGRGQAR